MKAHIKHILLAVVCAWSAGISAQHVNTMYFLENTPMRHTLNPAFQPVSKGYFSLPVVGYMSLWAGNNNLSLADLIYVNPNNPNQTITALHPEADRNALLDKLGRNTILHMDANINLLAFGHRVREKGYWSVGITERIDLGAHLPEGLFQFALGGGMQDIEGGLNHIDLSGLNVGSSVYTEIALGYSHEINERWCVGGKLKVLLGSMYLGTDTKSLGIDASIDEWRLNGEMDVTMAAPVDFAAINRAESINDLREMGLSTILGLNGDATGIASFLPLLKPSGLGAAVDLGVTYKPLKFMQVTAAITDLGFIRWNNSNRTTMTIDTTFTGAGEFNYNDFVVDGQFSTDSLVNTVVGNALGVLQSAHMSMTDEKFNSLLNMKLNIGVDFNFLNNLIGVGVLSRTKIVNRKAQEEVTVGVAVRPFNWLNVALSYSLIDNGHYSNFGAGLSIMPIDGLNLTVAADYIPTFYTQGTPLPYHIKGVNAAIGLTFVWGTNSKKKKAVDESI